MSQETEVELQIKLIKLKNGEQFVASVGNVREDDTLIMFNPMILNLVPMDESGQQVGIQTRPWLMFNLQDEPIEIHLSDVMTITNVDPQVLKLFEEQGSTDPSSEIITPEKELVIP